MNFASKDLDALRQITSRVLIALIWAHVPVSIIIDLARGSDWSATAGFLVMPQPARGAFRAMDYRPG